RSRPGATGWWCSGTPTRRRSACSIGGATATSRWSRPKLDHLERRMSLPPGVSVAGLLSSRPEAFGLPLELLAGANGLDRVITSPHIQKTGLALAGFHEYLKPGRVLIFGESEIRYLESLESAGRSTSLRL